MRIIQFHRGRWVRPLAGCVALVFLVLSATGCSTVKVKPLDENVILIVKKFKAPPDPVIPEGAVIRSYKLQDGDKILLINRYGGDVEVLFEPGVIEGEHEFLMNSGEERVVTIRFAGAPPTSIHVRFVDEGGDHGGADMIVEPPGG